MCIMDSLDQVLRGKTMRMVKVMWQHRGVEKVTWESEDTMRATYPSYLRMQVRCLVIWYLNDYCISMRL